MIEIYKTTKKRLETNPISVVILLLGLVISMLMLSFCISFFTKLKSLRDDKNLNAPPNALMFSINLNDDNIVPIENIIREIKFQNVNTGSIVNNILVNIDKAPVDSYFQVSAEQFMGDTNWHYPIVEGRYYSIEEVGVGLKVALIGNGLKKYMDCRNGKNFIKIFGEEYEVIGIVGIEDKESLWDERVFMPVKALPLVNKEKMQGGNVSLIFYNSDNNTYDEIKNFHDRILKNWPKAEITEVKPIETENLTKNAIVNTDSLLFIGVLVYIISVINAINIVSFWIEQRRYEIGVRKAFGHSNMQIAYLIFQEILGIAIVSCIIALLIQILIGVFINNVLGYTLELYATNLVTGAIGTLSTALITSSFPIVKSLKVQPIKAMES